MKSYDVLSPDGFSINPCENYRTIKSAKDGLEKWVKRYEVQGYYSSVQYGRISLTEIHKYCQLIKN